MPRETKASSSSGSTPYRSKPSSSRQAKVDAAAAKIAKELELEEFAQSYFKYTKLFEEQGAAMRHDPIKLQAAYDKVSAEIPKGQEGILSMYARTPEQIREDLKELARRCEIVPQSFEDRIRIGYCAHTYVRTMMDRVVAGPDKPRKDLLTVIGRGCQLLREDMQRQLSQNPNSVQHSPPPTMTPPIVKLTPDSKITRLVEEQDIANWFSNPGVIVGKGFISDEMVRRVFVVVDYAVKQVKGAQYDVVYEDSGLDDVQVVDPDMLVEMVTGAELITNM